MARNSTGGGFDPDDLPMAARITRVETPGCEWNAWRIGPLIAVQACGGDFFATQQVCYNQADHATWVITTWEIDGETQAHTLVGTNSDWPRFWSHFLGVLPSTLAAEIAAHEHDLRY